MPLLLTQNDLRPLLEESVQEGLQVIREALLTSAADQSGYLSWLAFPLPNGQQRINLQALMSPQAGTMIRAFPTVGHRTTADASLVLLFDDRTPAGLTGRG